MVEEANKLSEIMIYKDKYIYFLFIKIKKSKKKAKKKIILRMHLQVF